MSTHSLIKSIFAIAALLNAGHSYSQNSQRLIKETETTNTQPFSQSPTPSSPVLELMQKMDTMYTDKNISITPQDVEKIFKQKANLNERASETGDTLLHYLADAPINYEGLMEGAETLLKNGALILPNNYNETPVHIAARKGNVAMLKLLVKYTKKEDIYALVNQPTKIITDDEDEFGLITPLHQAASCCGCKKCINQRGRDPRGAVKFLIEQGARIDAKDSEGSTPVLYTASLPVLKFFVEEMNCSIFDEINNYGYDLLDTAFYYNCTEMLSYLINKGLSLDAPHAQSMLSRIYINQEDMIPVLLNNGADINKIDNSGWPIIERIVYNANLNPKKYFNAYLEFITFLVNKGAYIKVLAKAIDYFDLSKPNSTALIEHLTNLGFDLNSPDNFGETILTKAAQQDLPNRVIFLLKKGANPYITDTFGKRPIMHAKSIATLKAFIDSDIHSYKTNSDDTLHAPGNLMLSLDNNGKTLLHYAVEQGSTEMTTYLLKNGLLTWINKPDAVGRAPLYYIDPREDSAYDLAKLLLDNGALIDEKNTYRFSTATTHIIHKLNSEAFSLDEFKKITKFIDYLLSKGADINVGIESFYKPVIDNFELTHPLADHLLTYLAKHGANLNHQQLTSGDTLLHKAAYEKLPDMIVLLINLGANWNLLNNVGESSPSLIMDTWNNLKNRNVHCEKIIKTILTKLAGYPLELPFKKPVDTAVINGFLIALDCAQVKTIAHDTLEYVCYQFIKAISTKEKLSLTNQEKILCDQYFTMRPEGFREVIIQQLNFSKNMHNHQKTLFSGMNKNFFHDIKTDLKKK
ncbi:TPA: hypothetical protein DDZ86_00250 [Candidatus Dependentiae bacterium]|nr:MAG: Serine/threonine-protein phosphatase 6 regulatory ankyrin repeat subunit C [candidate division TM6 bacterium GW2011_GWF2_43_87]HBL98059.1 hypothetical protein [Candidatus Dependentiae bacterium]